MQGEVIGITSQIESNSGGSEGVGFAVPSNTVATVVARVLGNAAT
jgi:S1-C subfamily serine protease